MLLEGLGLGIFISGIVHRAYALLNFAFHFISVYSIIQLNKIGWIVNKTKSQAQRAKSTRISTTMMNFSKMTTLDKQLMRQL